MPYKKDSALHHVKAKTPILSQRNRLLKKSCWRCSNFVPATKCSMDDIWPQKLGYTQNQ